MIHGKIGYKKGIHKSMKIDYQKIFAPIAKMNTIKILLSIMVKPRMEHLSN
jgi:hypothetical protein